MLYALNISTETSVGDMTRAFSKQSLDSMTSNINIDTKYPLEFESLSLLNTAPVSYKYAQAMMSSNYAEKYPKYCFNVLISA